MPANGYLYFPTSPGTLGGTFYYAIGTNPAESKVICWRTDGNITLSTSGPFYLDTFTYGAGPVFAPPAGPTSALWSLSGIDYDAGDRIAPLCVDSTSNVWCAGTPRGLGRNILQCYDSTSGSVISSNSIYTSNHFIGNIVPFVSAGTPHIAVIVLHVNPSLLAIDAAILQIYNTGFGSPSDVGSLTFSIDGVSFTDAMNLSVFYDGNGSLFVMKFSVPGSGIPTDATIYKVALSGMVIVGSVTFSDTYGFIGNPHDGHIYLLHVSGGVSDLDNDLSVVALYPGLAPATSGFGIAASPYGEAPCVNLMKNPHYGNSVDPGTEQFFMTSGSSFTGFSRVDSFTQMDLLQIPTDWGFASDYAMGTGSVVLNGDIAGFVWTPFRQGIFTSGGHEGDNVGRGFYEFDYTPVVIPNPCAGVTEEFR